MGFEQYSNITRLKDFAASLDEVFRVAVEMNVDAVVDTGDTFNSPHPDPYSIMAMRRFVEKLHRLDIQFIGVIGNHNRHEIQDKIPGTSWFSAVSDHIIRPMIPEIPTKIRSLKQEDASIHVVAADWMPSSDLPAFLSRIGMKLDALFLHQSCEQFLPSVAKPELMLSQVDGIARYVGVGDVHVTKSVVTPQGTIVGSSGSTEMAKRDEDPLKYVMLVAFDCENQSKPPTCERIQIITRGVITFPVITISEHIPPFIDSVARQLIPGVRPPMVVVAYSRRLHVEMAVAADRIKEMGVEIIRLIPETEVKAEEEMQQIHASGSVLMEEIIVEMLKDSREVADLCLELWSAPANATTIIESYTSRIKTQYENQGIQPEEHIPAPPP